jgi:nucleoside-diphosphate-sugar epimerase
MSKKIVISGGAGLVGQNLCLFLVRRGYENIIVLDKHKKNCQILSRLQKEVQVKNLDLADTNQLPQILRDADVLVLLHAQIGGNEESDFVRNNIDATAKIVSAAKDANVPYCIHVSSSVVNSSVDDFYSTTKRSQEVIILESGLDSIVLRPTLMYGWFDRKHLGWLARFMKACPIFPVPGDGHFLRQPLYVADFCGIIVSALENKKRGIFDISGLEKIRYVDLVRLIRKSIKSKTLILPIPIIVFRALLAFWGIFDRNPPFTNKQLTALISEETFPIFDWPKEFSVTSTSIADGISNTFGDGEFSQVKLDF